MLVDNHQNNCLAPEQENRYTGTVKTDIKFWIKSIFWVEPPDFENSAIDIQSNPPEIGDLLNSLLKPQISFNSTNSPFHSHRGLRLVISSWLSELVLQQHLLIQQMHYFFFPHCNQGLAFWPCFCPRSQWSQKIYPGCLCWDRNFRPLGTSSTSCWEGTVSKATSCCSFCH